MGKQPRQGQQGVGNAIVPEEKPDWMEAYEEALGWPRPNDGTEAECQRLSLQCSAKSADEFHRLLPVPFWGPIPAPPWLLNFRTLPESGWDPNRLPHNNSLSARAASRAASKSAATGRMTAQEGVPPLSVIPICCCRRAAVALLSSVSGGLRFLHVAT